MALSMGCALKEPAPKPEERLIADNVTIEGQVVGNMIPGEASRVLVNLAKAKDIPAVNAGFDPDSGEVMPEKPGQRLQVSATLNALLAAKAGDSVTPVYEVFAPDITRDKLARSRKLGSYTTNIWDRSPGRMANIRLGAKLINNTVLEPGQEFSFNRITGEPTAERGFQPAIVYGDDGENQEEFGGGLCQVSSTLYNAVLAGNLKITERHPHSQPVNYVPPGKDATTYTDKDFRFMNNTRRKIMQRAFVEVEAARLTVELWELPDV
ncbi:VanW family protein [Sporomusa acidovorans]|uniref:Vancomycin B-type resistance protein VanW n=1 Tax=Sporomusa acidovorans (strain ATCC 49682 / DSM 3132 / Mol) TaxID=1123286 RepID=A0ABZ3IWN5_SPOA4|nr:VanW family protein [Sporomusa acidovorans]OZC23624.1 vancomycin B-type resistance protein VanW [Sporomusa acidovorans DSM 3132]SDE22855.1 VanW like protein [Sporomusa acidovorans]